MNQVKDANNYFNKSKAILTEINDNRALATVYNNLGNLENDKKRYLLALENYKKAVELADTSDMFYYSSYTYNLGQTYYYFLYS